MIHNRNHNHNHYNCHTFVSHALLQKNILSPQLQASAQKKLEWLDKGSIFTARRRTLSSGVAAASAMRSFFEINCNVTVLVDISNGTSIAWIKSDTCVVLSCNNDVRLVQLKGLPRSFVSVQEAQILPAFHGLSSRLFKKPPSLDLTLQLHVHRPLLTRKQCLLLLLLNRSSFLWRKFHIPRQKWTSVALMSRIRDALMSRICSSTTFRRFLCVEPKCTRHDKRQRV